jgi:hypothetical protein
MLLHPTVDLAVQLRYLLGGLFVLDELPHEQIRAFTDQLVDLHPRRYLEPGLLKGLRPRLGVQVVRVHQRAIYVEYHDLCHVACLLTV